MGQGDGQNSERGYRGAEGVSFPGQKKIVGMIVVLVSAFLLGRHVMTPGYRDALDLQRALFVI